MRSYKLHLAFLFFIALAFFHVSQAQNSQEDYLTTHNSARSEVGVGSMTWDDTVATYAQNYANQRAEDCNLVHSGGSYGENLAWSSGDMSATDAVNMWVAEKTYYDYNSNSCAEGQQCGHYTQVVWRNSVRLGCARVQCSSGSGTFIICNYDPPGNYVGINNVLMQASIMSKHLSKSERPRRVNGHLDTDRESLLSSPTEGV
ncbi:hypothetical protein NE237_026310 [Protea cynaroides]|uniref:SCP domain-containing protein n=1 Tax=Protea cynaroides TaxID=273540 RepID=A0A9Q0H8P6_9MAGN|nr:hypothetical protein NE237_026310 [Protea cynaroides]